MTHTADGVLRRSPTRVEFDVWSSTATLVVTDPGDLAAAVAELNDELAGIEATCSRFRSDSEISQLLRHPVVDAPLSPLLNTAIAAALRVAAATDYLVDPTVAAAVIAVGYDRDITDVLSQAVAGHRPDHDRHAFSPAAPGAWRIQHDADSARLTIPPGVGIDLGASAKALAADRSAARIADITGGGVLVGIGGDIAVAGRPPQGGWRIAVGEDHRDGSPSHHTVSITSGGLATSSTTTRRWPTRTGWAHHIIDPRTGANPDPLWRTVSVAAASCLDANAGSLAAIVLGAAAPNWLTQQGLPAMLIDMDGAATTLAGWPRSEVAA